MDQSDSRLTRLEEALAFSERTVEQMHGELVALQRRVETIGSRLARAETALAQRADAPRERREGDPPVDIELPPHSHRPVDRGAGRTNDPFGPTTPPPDTLGDGGRPGSAPSRS